MTGPTPTEVFCLYKDIDSPGPSGCSLGVRAGTQSQTINARTQEKADIGGATGQFHTRPAGGAVFPPFFVHLIIGNYQNLKNHIPILTAGR